MFADPLVQRYLDVNCSDYEYGEIKCWLDLKICPNCSFKQEISIHVTQILDDEQYLIQEYVKCECRNPMCRAVKFFHRNLD